MKKLILIIIIFFMIYLLLSSVINYIFPLQNDVYDTGVEGFSGNTAGYMNVTSFSPYNSSGTVYNIYDTIYFDKVNGNLIIMNDTGDSSSTIQIFKRINTSNPASTKYAARDSSGNLISQQTIESQIQTISESATTSWTYQTSSYQITYIPFNKDTYIHVMDITTQSPAIFLSAFFTDPTASNGGTQDYYLWTSSESSATVGQSLNVTAGSYNGGASTNDGTNVIEQYYDTSDPVYQISQYVKYDTSNGNLLVEGTDSSGNKIITVYARTGGTTTYTSTDNAVTLGGSTPSSSVNTLTANVIKPILAIDSLQTNIVIYWPVMNNTIITEFQGVLNSTSSGINLVGVTLFIGNAAFTGKSAAAVVSPPPTPTSVAAGSATELPSGMDAMMSNYFKWFYYWNMMGGGANNLQDPDKYILKTQVVPPVCPAQNCPALSAVAPAPAPAATSGGVGEDIGDSANRTGNVISDSVYGTGELASDVVRGTGDLASDTIRGTGKLASDAIRGTGSFAKEAVENTAEAVSSGVEYVGTGVGNFLGKLTKTNPAYVGGGGYGSGAYGANGGAKYSPDVYSYGGSINSQYGRTGSGRPDPIPVTADFSKFGR